MSKLLNVCFIRDEGRYVKRGFVADIPFDSPIPYTKPFIVVRVDASTIPEGLDKNNTVQLKLDKLLSDPQYQPKDIVTVDEDGKETTTTPPHYFAEGGVSCEPFPIISIEDVTWQ